MRPGGTGTQPSGPTATDTGDVGADAAAAVAAAVAQLADPATRAPLLAGARRIAGAGRAALADEARALLAMMHARTAERRS